MGEVADMLIDGILCEGCGEYIGSAVGYPRRCSGCGGGGYDTTPADWKIKEGEKIEQLRSKGYTVQKFTDFHFRINNKIDVWPSVGKYWVKGTKVKGRYYDLNSLLEKLK